MTLPPRTFSKRRRDGRIRDANHRKWIRTFACCVPMCNEEGAIDAHHIKSAEQPTAMGMKPGDDWCVSMCRTHHTVLHQVGEGEFMKRFGVDLVAMAKEFAATSPALKRLRAAPAPSIYSHHKGQ